jgi:hypothetical protein
MADEKIVTELLDELSQMCELDKDTVAQLRPGLLKVIQKHMGAFGDAPAPAKKGKKGTAKRVTTKSDKIPHKNGYHFFVAAKMGEVKEAGVGAKDRMKTIGEMWKKLTEAEKVPFQEKAKTYNDSVEAEMKTTGWEARRESIVAAANLASGAPPKKEAAKPVKAPKPEPVPEPEVEDEEEEAEEEEEVEEVKPAPKPAPVKEPEVVAKTAEAPVRRKKATATK